MRIASTKPAFILGILLLAVSVQQVCLADNADDHIASSASNSIAPFLVVGGLSLLADGKAAKPEMIQGAKALAATGMITEALKLSVREKRPNSNSTTSFPSGHTSAAFAMATVLTDYHPNYAIPAYALAATIGWSRVEVNAHHWQDVIAGAALGYFTAKHFTNEHIVPNANGLNYQWKW